MLGVDIEENKRFNKDRISDSKFLERIFTKLELDYCYSKSNPAPHLCARFCAKEAVMKVCTYKGISILKYNDIEIYNGSKGEPYVSILDNNHKDIKIDISISHNKTNSIAVAMIKE